MDQPRQLYWAWASGTVALGALWLASGSVYLPHVDDFYIISWAKTVAEGAGVPVHALRRFYPEPDYFLNAPRLHIFSLASWIRAFGWSLESLLAFRAVLYAATALIVIAVALRRDFTIVAVLFPVVLLVSMLHTGQRPESTALLLFVAGLSVLWNDCGGTNSSPPAARTLAKIAVVLAPLAWPSALAYGAALLIVSDLRDRNRVPLKQLVVEDALALATGILALGLMVGFDYAEFLRVYLGVTAEHSDIVSLNRMRLANGSALLAGAYLVRKRSPDAAFLAGVVGLGMLFGLLLHTKIAISMPLNGLVLLALLDGASRDAAWRRWAWAAAIPVLAVLLTNQAVFAIGAKASPSAAAGVKEFAAQARREGRTLLVDEIGAIYGLDLDIDGVTSWTFSRLHPDGRPRSVTEIREGESWIISSYTIRGWLKSQVVEGFPAPDPAIEGFLPGTPCFSGRNSCRLPDTRWVYFLVERRNGTVMVRTVS